MKGKRIIIAVTNDLVADQRVYRTALSLARHGAIPLVIGRKLPGSPGLPDRPYRARRLRLLFRKGPLFYACYNLRLLLFLLLHRSDVLVANDLDTLPACFLASRIRRITLVYDSHEYFTEVPELVGRRFTRSIWKAMEKRMLPRIRFATTVSGSVADAYREQYGIRMEVVRNLPICEKMPPARPDLRRCGPKRIIIYQGVLNVGRGLENMIRAMQYLEDFLFEVYGDGDIAGELKRLRQDLKLEDRVRFGGRLPFEELKDITRQASLGISLEQDRGLNYRFALPNKLFDYIQAGVPVLVSDLPEMRKVVEDYDIGQILKDPDPEKLAEQVREMMNAHELRRKWKKNLRRAAQELCWETEEDKLLGIFREALSQHADRSGGK